jgi:hypothetical protein
VSKSRQSNQTVKFHQALVELMNAALGYWCACGSTKIELIQQCSAWSAASGSNYQRSRTFNRYLQIATLPRYPHTELVFQTAYFVLHYHTTPSPERAHLETTLEQALFLEREAALDRS